MSAEEDEPLLRSVALQNANSILVARQRAEQELVRTKQQLELKTTELADSLSMMRATLEASTDGILVVDEEGKITSFNQNYLALWRLPRALADAKDHQALLDVVSRQFAQPQPFLARTEEVRAAAPIQSFDLLQLADGRVFERFSKIQVVDERRVGRVWIVRDITERRRAEEALQDETRVLELLHSTGRLLASTLELQSLAQAVTDATTQLSGAMFGAFFYNTKSDQGEPVALFTLSGLSTDTFAQFAQPRATALLGPTLRGEAAVRCDDVRRDPRYGHSAPHHGLPQGHPAVRSYLAVPVVSRSGEVLGGLFLGHPEVGMFTARIERIILGVAGQAAVAMDNALLYGAVQRAAQERARLLEAERAARLEVERVSLMKDEFLATLSHELRTPLNAILGWSELLLLRNTANDAKTGLETIVRNARAQTQLVEDLLDMSRIISGKIRLDVQQTDLRSVVMAAVESIRPSAEGKGIRLRTILDPLAGPVTGDPNRLQQVVWNLLSNAVKFTPKGGKVDVLLERVNSHLEITIHDSGIGIEPQFLPHVFERFEQADSSTTRRYGGLGLGLSIVKQLVELHGGSVHAHSPGAGLGATFSVSLPLGPVRQDEQRTHPTSPGAHPTERDRVDLAGVRVLVIDDEPDARELIRSALEDSQAEVVTAGCASEGLELLRIHRPHVVVSDIGMPGQDGYQFIRELRNLSADDGGKTPAIALTAFARSEDRTRALRAGYQLHIAKPIEPLELVVTVGSLAGRHE